MPSRFDILKLAIDTIENDKHVMRRLFPVLKCGGSFSLIIGFFTIMLAFIHFIPYDTYFTLGLAIFGFGIVLFSFHFANQQVLANDNYKKKMLKMIDRIDGNLISHLRKDPYPEFLQSYEQCRKTLYFAIGFVTVGLLLSIFALTQGISSPTSSWVEELTIGFSFLIFSTLFEQRFVDYYEHSHIEARLNRIEKYSEDVLNDC
jgi:hypothetical protein